MKKTLLVIISMAVTILLFEIFFSLAGFIYKNYRAENKKIVTKKQDNIIKILCLGDSHTFGEGAPGGYSYPEQLEALLNNNLNLNKQFIVYNAGLPGTNSSQLLKNLENNLQRFNPDMIIVMTGANNNSNFMQSNCFLFMDKTIKNLPYQADAFLSHMHSYKLLKTIPINLCNKIKPRLNGSREFFTGNDDVPRLVLAREKKKKKENLQSEFREEIKKHLDLGKTYEEQTEINLAIAEFKKAIEIDPYHANSYHLLGHTYLHRYPDIDNNANLLAVEAFKKAIEMNPSHLSAHYGLFSAYHRLEKINLV